MNLLKFFTTDLILQKSMKQKTKPQNCKKRRVTVISSNIKREKKACLENLSS